MNYSVFLGPDKKFIPDGKWDEYRAAGRMTLYDLVFRRHGPDGWYKATLYNGRDEIVLGEVMRDRRGEWSCIPNPSHLDKTVDSEGRQIAVRRYCQRGFGTRLSAAEYLMRVQEFTDPLKW